MLGGAGKLQQTLGHGLLTRVIGTQKHKVLTVIAQV